MLNIDSFKNAALYLFENNQKIMYYTFLESVKTDSNKVLVESIQNGFRALYEDNSTSLNQKDVHDAFGGYIKLANGLTELVAKFQGGEGAKETQKLTAIKNKTPGAGKLNVQTFGQGEAGKFNPVTKYEVVSGDPDDSDSAKAKAVLASSVIPLIVQTASNASKTSNYLEPAKDFIMELVSDELPVLVDKFQFDPNNPSSFYNYFKSFGMRNAYKRMIAKGSGVAMTSKVWGEGKEYKKGDVVNHAQKNWKALTDISSAENKVSPDQATNLWEQFGKASSDEMSTSATIGASKDDNEKEVGEVVKNDNDFGTAEETETNVDVKKLLSLLPDGKEKQALMMLYGIGMPRMTDAEIAEKLGTGRTNVHNLVNKAIGMIRSKAKVHA